MGMDRSSWIAVGFDFELDEVLKVLDQKTTPAVMQTEARFDQKTGESLEPVESVIQDEEIVYTIGGKEFDAEGGYQEIIDALAAKVGCVCDFYAGYTDGRMVFGIELKETCSPVELGGHVYIAGNYSLDALFKSKTKLTAIRKKLVKMGLEPGDAEIITCWEIN